MIYDTIDFSVDEYVSGKAFNTAWQISDDYAQYVENVRLLISDAVVKGIDEQKVITQSEFFLSVYYPNNGSKWVNHWSFDNAAPQAISFTYNGETKTYDIPYFRWEPEKNCIVVIDPKKKSWNFFSPNQIVPWSVYTEQETGNEWIQICYKQGERIRQYLIQPTDLLDPRKVSDGIRGLYNKGLSVTINPKLLTIYLQTAYEANKQHLNQKIFTKRMGWTDDCSEFIPYSNKYIYDQRMGADREFKSICSGKGNIRSWMQIMKPYRTDNHKEFRMALAASFSSVLVKPMNCPPYLLHIWSQKSSTGKTVVLRMIASVWGNPEEGAGLVKTLNSTDNALEITASIFNNFPLFLDELQTIQNQNDFSGLIYSLCEGIPKGRANSYGGTRNQNGWRNCIITTGEQSILSADSKAGAMNRVIEIEHDAALLSTDSHMIKEICDGIAVNYGQVGFFFVSKLREPEGISHAHEIFNDFVDQLSDGTTGKQARSASLLLTADTLIDEWIFHDGVRLTVDDIRPYLKSDQDVAVYERAHQALTNWVTLNQEKMKGQSGCIGKKVIPQNGAVYCAFDKNQFAALMERLGYNANSYISWAKQNGKLVHDNNHLTKNVKFNGKIVVCYAVLYEPPTQIAQL